MPAGKKNEGAMQFCTAGQCHAAKLFTALCRGAFVRTRAACLFSLLGCLAAACVQNSTGENALNSVPVSDIGGENVRNPNRPISLVPFRVSAGYAQKSLAAVDAFPSVLSTKTNLRAWRTTATDWAQVGFALSANSALGLPAALINDDSFYYPTYVGAPAGLTRNCGATCSLGALVAASLLDHPAPFVERVSSYIKYFSSSAGDSHAMITGSNSAYIARDLKSSSELLYAGVLWSQAVAIDTDFAAGIGGPAFVAHSRSLVPVIKNMVADAWQHRTFDAQSQTVQVNANDRWDTPAALAYTAYQGFLLSGDASLLAAATAAMDAYGSAPNVVLEVEMGGLAPLMAARLNAEQAKSYDLPRLLTLMTDKQKVLLSGVLGQTDFSGLMGSPTTWGGYAQAQHTFQMAAWLAPIARYAPGYARAIGKWLTSIAYNATRFYPDALAPADQVDYPWYQASHLALAYEGTAASTTDSVDASSTPVGGRGLTPVPGGARGPALAAAWGAAYMARLLVPTNVAGVLAFDLLVTDFQHAPAYPSYLYYNATNKSQTVNVDVGAAPTDIIDTTSGATLVVGARGLTPVTIGADAAMVLVLAPNNLPHAKTAKRTLIDGITVDWGIGP